MKSKLIDYLILIVFILVLSLPMLDRKLHIFPVIESTEKRELAPRPKYKELSSIPELFHSFDQYWNDNFGGRSNLISIQAKIWVRLFKESPIPSVVVGKEGWSFYKSEAKKDGHGINDYQGLADLSAQEQKEIISSLVETHNKLKNRGITFIVLVAPNKQTIYPEMLPNNIKKYRDSTRLDMLLRVLPNELNVMDPREALINNKNFMPTYLMTDSHWSPYGAMIAVTEIIKKYPGITPVSAQEIGQYKVIAESVLGEGDLVSMMSARGLFKDVSQIFKHQSDITTHSENFQYYNYKYIGDVIRQSNQKLPTLYFTGDSFASYMYPFFAPYFSNVYMRTYSASGLFDDEFLDTIKPNVIIWEVSERYINRLATN